MATLPPKLANGRQVVRLRLSCLTKMTPNGCVFGWSGPNHRGLATHVCSWPNAEKPLRCNHFVRSLGFCGRDMLAVSLSAFDPNRKSSRYRIGVGTDGKANVGRGRESSKSAHKKFGDSSR